MDSTAYQVKMVIVGDGCVGKTCMLFSYSKDHFPTEYVPTVFDNYAASLKVDGKSVSLGLWDTAGQQQYARLRTLAYTGCDIFLIVFDVNEPTTFTNAIKKWYPQLNQSNPQSFKIIVGNKIDLRKEDSDKCVSKSTATKVVKDLGCTYMECSAMEQTGLKQVFQEGIRKVIEAKSSKNNKPKKSSCSLI